MSEVKTEDDVRDFRLPDLGEGLEEGEIVAWHVTVGDEVALNQPVADIETAKAVVSVPSPFAGRVIARVGEVGDTLAVGSLLLRVRVGDAATGSGGNGGAISRHVDPSVEDAPRRHVDEQDAGDATPPATSDAAGDDAERVTVIPPGAVPSATSPGDARPDVDEPADARPVEETVDAPGSDEADTSADADTAEPAPLVGYGSDRRHSPSAAAASTDDAQVDDGPRPRAKPPVRKLAKDLGIDLAGVSGTGQDGIITREDVTAAAYGHRDVPPTDRHTPSFGFRGRRPGEVEQIRTIRKRIVEKMERSRREIPTASATRDVDLTRVWNLRRALTEQARDDGFDIRVTPFAVLLRATVLGLRRFPTLNAQLVGRDPERGEAGEIHLLEDINLGVAVDTDRGLVVPNIKKAQAKSLLTIAGELNDLARQARDGDIAPADVTGGTFTVNNYGAFGNDDGDPIINHPEAGILGIGAIRERPWVVDGEIVVRRIGKLRLVFDHRICDGGEAGRFVAYVADLCEEPSRILLHA